MPGSGNDEMGSIEPLLRRFPRLLGFFGCEVEFDPQTADHVVTVKPREDQLCRDAQRLNLFHMTMDVPRRPESSDGRVKGQFVLPPGWPSAPTHVSPQAARAVAFVRDRTS
jgi:hypothetical protein